MLPHRSRPAVPVVSIGALLALSLVPTARAAADIKFKEMKVGLSHAHHRPMPPIIVIQRMDGAWKPSGLPVQFELSVSAKVNTFSSIFRLMIGVPSIAENSFTAWTAGYAEGSTKVDVGSTTFHLRADQLALSPVSSGDLCAQAAPGRGNDFMVPFRLPIEVQVAASRGKKQGFKTYSREIDAAARCIVLSETEADHPQRTPVKPQRTPVEPQRTPVEPQRTPIEPQRTKVEPRPDLIVRRTRAVPGDMGLLEVEVANVGKGDAGITHLKLFYNRSGHRLVREVRVPALGAGDSKWVAIETPGALAPGVRATLRVDEPNQVLEADERNNALELN